MSDDARVNGDGRTRYRRLALRRVEPKALNVDPLPGPLPAVFPAVPCDVCQHPGVPRILARLELDA